MDGWLGRHRPHARGRGRADRHLAGLRDPATERGGRVVAAAGGEQRARCESDQRSALVELGAHLHGAVADDGHELDREAGVATGLGAPRPAAPVVQEAARGGGAIGRGLARQPAGDEVLGREGCARAPDRVGQVARRPDEVRQDEAGDRRRAARHQEPLASEPIEQGGGLVGVAPIGPVDAGGDRRSGVVHEHRDVALADDARGGDRRRVDPGLVQEPADRLAGGAKPVVGVVLGPARVRATHRVRDLRDADEAVLAVGEHGLEGGRPDVEPDEVGAPQCVPLPAGSHCSCHQAAMNSMSSGPSCGTSTPWARASR